MQSIQTQEIATQRQFEALLNQCDWELLEMSQIAERGFDIPLSCAKASPFRFLWIKLTTPLRKQAEFYKKGFNS